MKKYFILTSIVILIILALLFVPGLTGLDINPFQKTTLVYKSLESIKTVKISQFRSTSYSYKTLFPYDFIIGEPQWGSILYKNNKFLTEEDLINRKFYYECKNIGIDLNKTNYFFIIKINATAGFDLESYIEDPIINANEVNKRLILKSPESTILSLEVVDDLKENNYPDINITPGQWRDLITLILPDIKKEIINRGLLDSSDKTNKIFLEKIFGSMGWEYIEFK